MLKFGNFNVRLQTITITNEGHETDISHVFCFSFFLYIYMRSVWKSNLVNQSHITKAYY